MVITAGNEATAKQINNELRNTKWIVLLNQVGEQKNIYYRSIAGHTASVYSISDSTGVIYNTVDNGLTYTNRLQLSKTPLMRAVRDTPTNALAVEQITTGATAALTTDSGSSWARAGGVGNDHFILDLSVPSTTLAVVCTIKGVSNNVIYRSVDNGATWSPASTQPGSSVTNRCVSVDMWDGVTGWCIIEINEANGQIWETGDGADNWTFTGVTVGFTPEVGHSLSAIRQDTFLYHHSETAEFYRYTNGMTADLQGYGPLQYGDTGVLFGGKFLKANNGTYYAFVQSTTLPSRQLMFRTSTGTSFEILNLPGMGLSGTGTTASAINKCTVTMAGPENLIVVAGTSDTESDRSIIYSLDVED